MIEALLWENPFCHVSKRELVAPLIDLFLSRTRSGRENSVFLRKHAQDVLPTADILLDAEQRLMSEFSAACQDAVDFAQRMASGQVGMPSPEMLALAKRAAQQCAARNNEDVQVWAEQLARDVGNAVD
jgi:hypothetical protein